MTMPLQPNEAKPGPVMPRDFMITPTNPQQPFQTTKSGSNRGSK